MDDRPKVKTQSRLCVLSVCLSDTSARFYLSNDLIHLSACRSTYLSFSANEYNAQIAIGLHESQCQADR